MDNGRLIAAVRQASNNTYEASMRNAHSFIADCGQRQWTLTSPLNSFIMRFYGVAIQLNAHSRLNASPIQLLFVQKLLLRSKCD